MTQTQQESGLAETLDEIGVGTQPAKKLLDEFDNTAEMLDFYRRGGGFKEIDGVGRQTSLRVTSWLEDEDPNAKRERYEQDEGIATEFVSYVPEDDEPRFAFICPRCGDENRCAGDPQGFAGRPYACRNCNWVSLMSSIHIDAFREENPEVVST